MASLLISSFIFTILAFFIVESNSSEVPVLMWETAKTIHKVPAMSKVNSDTFKEFILQKISNANVHIVIFKEENLSPEDFIQTDKNVFNQLSQIDKVARVTYFPLVENSISVLKNIQKKWKEVSIEDFKGHKFENEEILVITMNDVKDDEDRVDMLTRHDAQIVEIYNQIVKENEGQNVLAILTGMHSSWIIPEEIRTGHHIHTRQAKAETQFFKDGVALYFGSNPIYDKKEVTIENMERKDNITTLKTNQGDIELVTEFNGGYWFVSSIKLGTVEFVPENIYAPEGFSYHCTISSFKTTTDKEEHTLEFPKWQMQINRESTVEIKSFGDAYDCVGFTTAPIWSGIFVTFILAIIMTIGLTMMMDIKTMDRFDDPKGKTIIINAQE